MSKSIDLKTPEQINSLPSPDSCASPQNTVTVFQREYAYINERVCGKNSKALLEYKNASGFKMSVISKAGMEIIKMAKSQWKRQEKKTMVVRSSSTGNSHSSSDRHLCKNTLDQLRAILLHGDKFPKLPCNKLRQDKICSAKPQNCKRIVVLGAPRVGKTSILQWFLRDSFEERYEPTSEDFHRKLYQIRGETYQIDILDASRERGFPAKRRLSILTGDIFLLVFSVDDRNSFEEVRALHEEIVVAKSKLLKTKANNCAPTIICANKTDIEQQRRVIHWDEVRQAFGEDCTLFETSAKNSTNLEDVFEALAKRGGLPTETLPSQHRKISIRSYQALRTGRQSDRSSRAHAIDVPYGALHPLVRRPSFSTDLRQVLGRDQTDKRSKPLERCQIQ